MRLQPLTGIGCLALTCLATTVACGPTAPPELDGLTDVVGQVGTEIDVNLNGTTINGAQLTYAYKAADLTDLAGNAQITVSPSGEGVFRWTPLAADVGKHAFDFSATAAGSTTTVTITIEVKSAIGAATAPIFRQPLGTGTTVNLVTATCVDVDVVIDDSDSPMVTIAQEEPVIDGAMLTKTTGLTAKWHWCPSKAQQAENRYTLVLSASDGDNPKTIKDYLVVLAGDTGTSCPGAPPAILHTASDQTTILDLALTAEVTDDKGLKDAPLFYYSPTDPGANPVLGSMTQLSTTQTSGTSTDGFYAVTMPNPVAGMSAGSQATVYYVFVAEDDDDTMGNCDHTTTSQVYSMTVTAGGSAVATTCSACSDDSQCGDGNECVLMGDMGESFCLQGCDAGCASGYTCSAAAITSIDGASAPQCVPESGSCVMPTGSCVDDTWEDNDTRSEASHNPVLTPDTYNLVSCPSSTGTNSDDDWYKIVVAADSRVDLQLAGDGATDVDLHLYHSDGTVVSASTSLTPNEEISQCLPAATYYVKVNAYGHARSEYTLGYTQTAESCDATCVDDSNEDDDTFSQARETTAPSYTSTGNQICPNDDDWFHVPLTTGQTMTVDLTFTQTSEAQDLDLHLYQNGTDLTPCDVSDAADCSVANGQGSTSNEHTVFTAPDGCDDGCDYYVVVRGWDGASNGYDISIGVQ